jgi:hypothetical protein
MCISHRSIIKRDDIRYNYKCSPVLRQTLADCDAVASCRCQGFITEMGISAKSGNTNYGHEQVVSKIDC